MHDSSTCAPDAPSEFELKSKYNPAVDSLQASPKSKCLEVQIYGYKFNPASSCPLSTHFNASMGNLQKEMFKCLRLSELVKNCLKDGGISFPFFVLNELWDTFRWDR